MTTINKQITTGADDGYERDDTAWDFNDTTFRVGETYIGGWKSHDGGFRFQSVNIPQGATITTATFSVYLGGDTGTLQADMKGVDEDNCAAFAQASRPSGRAKTTAVISADEADWGNWGVGNWITLSVTSIIQEIVDRGGWSANNALGLVLVNNGSAGTVAYITIRAAEYAGGVSGAKLDVAYCVTEDVSVPITFVSTVAKAGDAQVFEDLSVSKVLSAVVDGVRVVPVGTSVSNVLGIIPTSEKIFEGILGLTNIQTLVLQGSAVDTGQLESIVYPAVTPTGFVSFSSGLLSLPVIPTIIPTRTFRPELYPRRIYKIPVENREYVIWRRG